MAEEHLEHSVFTWDPVGARWIHERGPLMSTPPVPPDVHAIQTYFYDPDEKEWIATVLAPRGRELAAQWEGAHKVPDQVTSANAPKKSTTAANKTAIPTPIITISNLPETKSGPPIPLFAIVLVLLLVGGGAAAVVAGTQSAPNASPAATTSAPGVSTNPSATVAASGEPTATPAGQTTSPTQAPGGTPVSTRTAAPTPAPTAPPPVANSITLSDGSIATYIGPSRVNIGEKFSVTFTVRNANNTPGTGTFLVSFGNSSTGGAKTSSGTLDGNGRIVLNMQGNSLPGNYPFVVNYKGLQGQVTIVRVG